MAITYIVYPCTNLLGNPIQELSLVVLACISVGAGEKSKALSLLTQAVAISPQSPKPLTLYNYCLLLTQIGKLNEAANGWLEMHSQLPTNKTEARHMIVNLKKSSNPRLVCMYELLQYNYYNLHA